MYETLPSSTALLLLVCSSALARAPPVNSFNEMHKKGAIYATYLLFCFYNSRLPKSHSRCVRGLLRLCLPNTADRDERLQESHHR
uniref:Putative secreted protein n=1 Tax=Ixodes ricinus TaxID=34613 RepID=A0A6B0U7N3_IXORI